MKYLFSGVTLCVFFGLLLFIISDQYKMISIPKDIRESFKIVPTTVGDYTKHTRRITVNTFGGTDKYEYTQYYKSVDNTLLQLSIYSYVPLNELDRDNFLTNGQEIKLTETLVGKKQVTENHQEIRWVEENQLYSLKLHDHSGKKRDVGDNIITLFKELWAGK